MARTFLLSIILFLALTQQPLTPPDQSAAQQAPATSGPTAATSNTAAARGVSEADFPRLIERLSEPGGYFDSDNLISNEASYLHVLGKMRKKMNVTGGAYIGVGPDQSFFLHRSDPPAHRLYDRHPARQLASAPLLQIALRALAQPA